MHQSIPRSTFCALFALGFIFSAQAQVNVTTWHNDVSRTGTNTQETILTPATVAAKNSFGQLYTVPLDGAVYAQPLYVSSLNISGGTHNVVFAATENDSVYAIDADTGAVLWQENFLGAGMTPLAASAINCSDIAPQIGITGTPVIDSGTGTLYAVSTAEPGPIQQLHAIDIRTGAEKFGGPVTISATVKGSGSGGNGVTVSFNPLMESQHAALALTNGHVVIAWGSHCDHGPYHGWVMSYNAATLAQETVFNTTPNGYDGGVWMSGAAPSVDATGNIYFGSSNGDFGGAANTDFSDTIFRMPPPVAGRAWLPADGFVPWNQQTMSQLNQDVGSGSVVVLPDLPAGALHPHRLVTAGKNGEIFVLDRNNMGRYCSLCANGQMDTNIVQELDSQLPNDMTGSPAYWNGSLYYGGSTSTLKAFSVDTITGALSTQPVQQGAYIYQRRGTTPSISSNGSSNGIVWTIDSGNYGGEILLAYDASNLNNLLYKTQFSTAQVHFAVPTIANGKVFAGGPNSLVAFGLLNTAPTLTVAAANVTVSYGQPVPSLTGYTVTGFQNGDTSSILSGAPTETTSAVQGSLPGAYPIVITQGSLAASNYSFYFVNGILTVTGIPPSVALSLAQNPIASGTPVTYTATVVGPSGQAAPAGTVILYATLPSGQVVPADGPHSLQAAGSGAASFTNTIFGSIPAGNYSLSVVFQPGPGSPYQSASSPQVMLTSQ